MTATLFFGLYAWAVAVPPPTCLRLDVLVLAVMGAVSPLCPLYRLAHSAQLKPDGVFGYFLANFSEILTNVLLMMYKKHG